MILKIQSDTILALDIVALHSVFRKEKALASFVDTSQKRAKRITPAREG
jgi:heme exporter protein D